MDSARDPKTFVSRFELDYFQRARNMRRWKWALSLIALVLSSVMVGAFVSIPRLHTAFQTAPVSHSHAAFGDNCAACHDQPFGTAGRFFSGTRGGTVSDAKCLTCHDAGQHTPHQLHNIGVDGKASGCIDCHKEHRGDALSNLSDLTCTMCHADLKTDNGQPHFHAHINHLADGHPPFGTWRKSPLVDPAGGKFSFNHKRHLELANELKDVSKESRPLLVAEAEKLSKLDCAYCHQTDTDMKRMQPIRYDDHCAACHPLNVQAMPAAHWPDDVSAAFAKQTLAHPAPGEGPAKIRATLLERYLRMSDRARLVAPAGAEPAILRSDEDPKEIQERERVAADRARKTEAQLFDRVGAGCALCHKELKRTDGLPEYAHPHQQRGRWKDELANWPTDRLRHKAYEDEANRWHPLATFNHAVHRVSACTDCHAARNSSRTEDVLIPTIDNCLNCHNRSATSAHSNCLTCHDYHDRSQEQPARFVTPDALKALLQRAKP